MTVKNDWNPIEVSKIYDTYDDALQILDVDFERIRRIMKAAILYGVNPDDMTKPVMEFAMAMYAYCKRVNIQKDIKQNKTQKT